jgi:hypothetical protein
MLRRSDLVLIAAGPVLAVSLLGVNALAGRALVEAVYAGRAPVDLLNDIITGQSVHAVEFHLHRARDLVHRMVWLLVVAGPLAAVYVASARRWPASPLAQPLMGGMLLSTAALCGLYLLRVPLLKVLPGWFWPLHDKPLPLVWLALPLAAGSWFVIRAVTEAPGRRHRNLLLLILWGACLQHGLVWLEGDGFAHLKQRMTDTGHAVFARTAVDQPSIWQVVTRYEELLVSEAPNAYFHANQATGAAGLPHGCRTALARVAGEGCRSPGESGGAALSRARLYLSGAALRAAAPGGAGPGQCRGRSALPVRTERGSHQPARRSVPVSAARRHLCLPLRARPDPQGGDGGGSRRALLLPVSVVLLRAAGSAATDPRPRLGDRPHVGVAAGGPHRQRRRRGMPCRISTSAVGDRLRCAAALDAGAGGTRSRQNRALGDG